MRMSDSDAAAFKAIAHLADRQAVLSASHGDRSCGLAEEAWRSAYFHAFRLTEPGHAYVINRFVASRLDHALLIESTA